MTIARHQATVPAIANEARPRNGYPISQDQIDQFQTDGAICLRQVFDLPEVDALREIVEGAIENPGRYATEFSGKGSGRFFGDVFVWTRHTSLGDLVVSSRLGEIAGKLLKAREARFFFDHLLVKEPGSIESTPWHQDSPYFPIEGDDCCSIWIALDPVTRESGAVEYALGTHVSGAEYAPQSFTATRELSDEGLEALPDMEARRGDFDIVHWNLEPGDCVVHHVRTIHGAPGNQSTATRRRGLAIRWIGDDVVFKARPGVLEPMIKTLADLAPDLRAGQPLDHPLFPKVWQRPGAQSETTDKTLARPIHRGASLLTDF